MNAAAHALRPKASPRPRPETTRRSASAAPPAAATPRYLRASLKLGGVNDPEEHEAKHAASVIAGGGCYQVVDPGGSTHLRAASAAEGHAHEPIRKLADSAAHEPIRKAAAEGAAPEPIRKAAAEGAAHEPIRKAAEGAAHEPIRKAAAEGAAHEPIRKMSDSAAHEPIRKAAAEVSAHEPIRKTADGAGHEPVRMVAAEGAPHEPIRKMADSAAHEPIRKAADGAAHEPIRKAAADGAAHEPIRKMADGAAHEPTRRMAADGAAHGPIRVAVAPPVLDIGASGRVRRAIAPPILDPGASGRVRSAAGTTAPGPSHDALQKIERARKAAARPLPPAVQARLERGFGERMDNVGLHTGPSARAAARAIGARAYTEGERITLGPGESEHDLHLLAHEATHVVQNRRAAGVPRALPADPTARRAPQGEIHRPEVRKAEAPKTEIRKAEAPQAQPIRRLPGMDTVLDKFADWANAIPGFRIFTLVLGMNPINRAKVDRSGANILRAAVELIPGGGLIVKALETYGIFEKGGAWLEQQIDALGMVGSEILNALMDFLHSTDLSDLVLHPGDSWDKAKRIFTGPIDHLGAFFKAAAQGFIDLIKDAVLKPLAALASKTPAWDLLTALLGENPITHEQVAQDASAIIGALMKLAGQEEIWKNIQDSGAIGKLSAWFGGAKTELVAFIQQIPGLFLAALKSFVIEDLLDLPGAIGRVIGMFGDFAAKFIGWVGKSLLKLLEIVVTAVSPNAWAYIQKTGAALKSILKNPLPFVGNLVAAAKLGFQNFAANIVTHLKTGLIDWLTGAVPGVYIPQALSLAEVGKFALSVLGITWAKIRGKIVKALGPNGETIMSALEKAFEIVKALVTGGVAAVWKLIMEKLSDLQSAVVEGIIGMVKDLVIQKAVPKLLAMFVPGAGFVAALLSIYDTIKVFVEKLAAIAAVVKSFVDSIVAIAAGQIGGAASRVESALAGLLSLAISFLAGFAGLGNVAAKVRDVIKKVQAKVDKAIDDAIAWIVAKAKALFAKLFGKKDKDKKDYSEAFAAVTEFVAAAQEGDAKQAEIDAGLAPLKAKYEFKKLAFVAKDGEGEVDAEINPAKVWRFGPTLGLTLIYNPAWPLDEFKAKAAAIKSASTVGQLMSLPANPSTGEQKTATEIRKEKPFKEQETTVLRAEVRKFIEDNVPEKAKKGYLLYMLGELIEADHQIDLQLSGKDAPSNLALISKAFNTKIGKDIQNIQKKLNTYPPSTNITYVAIDLSAAEKQAKSKKKVTATGTAAEFKGYLMIYAKGEDVIKVQSWFNV